MNIYLMLLFALNLNYPVDITIPDWNVDIQYVLDNFNATLCIDDKTE